MRTTNTETFPDAEVKEVLGVVRANTVRARNVGRDITQSLRQIVGGELKAYSSLLTRTRDEAMERMEEEAEAMDADAVVNVRFTTSQVTRNSAEILAYGTAVTLAE